MSLWKIRLDIFHTYAGTETDSFKYTVFNIFPAYFDQLLQDIRDQLSISGVSNEHQETFQKS